MRATSGPPMRIPASRLSLAPRSAGAIRLSIGLPLAALLAAAAFSGCSGPASSTMELRRTRQNQVESAPEDELSGVVQQLNELYKYDSREACLQCTLAINAWLETNPESDWSSDPLLAELPAKWQGSRLLAQLAARRVDIDSVESIEVKSWLRDVSRWARKQSLDADLEAWLETQRAELGPDAASLQTAAQLFDWTVRNLQLAEFLEQDGAYSRSMLLPMRQAVLRGQGDAWERARVFLELLHQAGIPGVMLATTTDAEGKPTPATPWLPAAWIGNELYLFDTQLALPIPAMESRGIATLRGLREHPEWIAQLDLGEERPYSVRPAQLQQLVAFVDAEPFSLSRAADLLEQRLTGENRIALTVRPSQIAKTLQKVDGVRVQIWDVAFESQLAGQRMEQRMRRDSVLRAQHEYEEAMFLSATPLSMGRKRHLRGQFDGLPGDPGAKTRYMEARSVTDSEIDQLPFNTGLQSAMGFVQGPTESDDAWRLRLLGSQAQMRHAKINASYWLGLIHFAEARYENAIQWFAKRTLEEQEGSWWRSGARYNMARAYERLGKTEEARNLYLEDDSPQQHGNLIRARRLTAKPAT